MKEIELKFLVPENKLTAIKRQTHIKASVNSHLSAHYFDTPEQDLAKHGIAVRIRQEGLINLHKSDSSNIEKNIKENEQWIQTLKTSGDGLASRLEHNHILDAEKAETDNNNHMLSPDLGIYQQTPIADVLQKLKKSKKLDINKLDKKLTRLYVTDVYRTTRLIKGKPHSDIVNDSTHSSQSIIEVAFDTGQVIHGENDEQKQAIQEVEFEILQGSNEFLFDVAKIWCKRYNLCLSTVTKAERGSLVLENQSHPKATKARLNSLSNTLHKHSTQPEFIRAVVHNCLLQIMPNASAIAAGCVTETNDEANAHVHQLRVGIRRLRTALKLLQGFSEQINPEWMPILKHTFSLLGDYRDREILRSKTQPMLEAIGSPKVDWEMDITVMPIDVVSENDFQITLLELIEFTMSDPSLESNQKPAQSKVTRILNKLFSKIAKSSSIFADITLDEQHDVRKRLKALRYLSEFSAPMYKRKATKAFIKYLEPAQEVLGDYNDNIVGHDFYANRATTEPQAYFAVGWFLAKEKQSAKTCAESLKTVKKAPIFW